MKRRTAGRPLTQGHCRAHVYMSCTVYDRFVAYCKRTGTSKSFFTDRAFTAELDNLESIEKIVRARKRGKGVGSETVG